MQRMRRPVRHRSRGCDQGLGDVQDAGKLPYDLVAPGAPSPGMGMVSLSVDASRRAVTASVPLLASRTAILDGASGCILEVK